MPQQEQVTYFSLFTQRFFPPKFFRENLSFFSNKLLPPNVGAMVLTLIILRLRSKLYSEIIIYPFVGLQASGETGVLQGSQTGKESRIKSSNKF